MRSARRGALVIAGVLSLGAIAGACTMMPGEPLGSTNAPLKLEAIEPMTEVYVDGAGALDVEDEYLPQVVCCENGAAHPEALKAQAVMARTYMFFRAAEDGLGTSDKPFSGTTKDQAYHCKVEVTDACKDAVAATRDEITAYTNEDGVAIANVSFFVDGPRPACLKDKNCTCERPSPKTPMTPDDHPAACECFTFSSMGAANPKYVTYNWSRSGGDVRGSTIGSLDNESNRGCASQNIQSCLGYAGLGYRDMLRFFYGQDIELRHTDGSLVDEPGDDPAPGDDAGRRLDGGSEPVVSSEAFAGESSGGCALTPRPASPGRAPRGALALSALALVLGMRRRRRALAASRPSP